MSISFLVDVGVGKAVERFLRDAGYDIKAVRDFDPKAKDADILQMAVAEKRMVITMDKDFGELVYRSGLPHAGVLILRMEDATGQEKALVLDEILKKFSTEIPGMFCVYQDNCLRIRA